MPPPDRITVGEWLDHWQAMHAPTVARLTAAQTKMYLTAYIPADIRKTKLQKLTPKRLEELNTEMAEPPEKPKPGREGKGLAPATRQKVFGLLRQSFRRAIVEGVLTTSPAEHLQIRATTEEQQARKRDEALTPEETDLLLRQAEGHPQECLVWILFSLGLRRGEALGLKWADVDFRNGVIRTELQYKIVGNDTELGPLKTTMSVRPNAMSEGLRVKLLAQLERQADWKLQCDDAWQDWGLVITTSVGTPMHPRNVNRLLADLADKAGIRHISSHVGRRTNITGQIRAGVPLDVVAARAGHRSSITTIRSYRTVLEDEKRAGGFDLEGYRKSGARTDSES